MIRPDRPLPPSDKRESPRPSSDTEKCCTSDHPPRPRDGKHDSKNDTGFKRTGGSLLDYYNPDPRRGVSDSHYAVLFHSREDRLAIRRVSKVATSWTFKWCSNQVEKGFTGHVVPPRPPPADVRLSGRYPDKVTKNKRERIYAWIRGVRA